MNKLFLRGIAASAVLLAFGPSAAPAADFSFVFSSDLTDPNVDNAVAGTVTGRILGLAEVGTSSAAQVWIDNFSPNPAAAYPVAATAWNAQFQNSFTVTGGNLVDARFHAEYETADAYDRLFINIPSSVGNVNYASVGVNNAISVWNNQGLNGIAFTRLDRSVVPEPATWAMLILGFGAVGWAMRRRGCAAPALAGAA